MSALSLHPSRLTLPGAARALRLELRRNAVPLLLPLLAAVFYYDTLRRADGIPPVWTLRASVIGNHMLNDGHGHYLYPGGEPYGSELAWAGVAVDPAADTSWPQDTFAYQIGTNYLKYMAYWQNPPASFKLSDFHFTVAEYDKLLPLAGIYDATDPDLSAFRQAGGKLIMYQGWADEKISPFGTVDYYKAVVQRAGGFAASQDFSRLYMIPDQNHCLSNGSPQVNTTEAKSMLLSSLQKWVERGVAPGSFSFPLVHPTAKLSAISVHPLNPLSQPPGGARGLDTQYHWVGQFRPVDELWCSTQGMDLVCDHHRPPISYTADTASKA
jgi:hypothetical protein